VRRLDPEIPGELEGLEPSFDTVLCLNVLEYLEDPGRTLASLRAVLKPNGIIVILVPNGPGLFGTLDRRLGHKRRYSSEEARRLLEEQGFDAERIYSFNKAGAPPWKIYGKALGAKDINKAVLKIFDKTVWLWRRIDRFMPWPGLTLIVVARKRADAAFTGG
jgi:SAM-dependent methyltransferase